MKNHGTNSTALAAIVWFIGLFEQSQPTEIVEWCERNLFVPDPARGSVRHWDASQYPHQPAILRDWADPEVREVVFVGSSQTAGKTTLGLGCTLWSTHQERTDAMVMQPSLELAEMFSRTKLHPAINASTALCGYYADPRSRSGSNTLRRKSFPGGYYSVIGSNSSASLRGSTAARLWADDAGAYVATTEGDPLELFRRRSAGVEGGKAKLLITTSPTEIQTDTVWALFLDSTACEWHVTCPHCREFVNLEGTPEKPFRCIRWQEGQPESATFFCPSCDANITESQRLSMYRGGAWRATQQHTRKGYRISAIWCPWTRAGTMGQAHHIITEWERVKNDREGRKAFINTTLGLPFLEVDPEMTWESLAARKSAADWREVRPAEVGMVTAGVDIQSDRIECAILGHGARGATWLLDYIVINGSPLDPDPWQALDEFLAAHLPQVALIDYGHASREVARFTILRRTRGIFACKGVPGDGSPLVKRSNTKATATLRSVPLYLVGTVTAKDALAQRVKSGCFNFPCWTSDDWLRQFTAEAPVVEVANGVKRRAWVLRPGQERNEALDCCVYALAAQAVALDTGRRSAPARPAKTAEAASTAPAPTPTPAPHQQETKAPTPAPLPRVGGIIRGRRW